MASSHGASPRDVCEQINRKAEMPYQLLADDGTPLDARFDIEDGSIVFHSRGGSKTKSGINLDYTPALTLLLTRLANAGFPVVQAWLDSQPAQRLPVAERMVLDPADANLPVAAQVRLMSKRMAGLARMPTAKSPQGNPTKRIRIKLPEGATEVDLVSHLKAVSIKSDSRSAARLPAAELAKVTAEHIDNAIRYLLKDPHSHPFGESTDYDVVLESGVRLPPKAVFGIAAAEALGFQVEPKHFTAGVDSVCFRTIEASGFLIRPKGESAEMVEAPLGKDQEWSEGTPRLRQHLSRERAYGLREAKKAAFRRTHGGRLFCEHCREDPVEKYGTEHAEACIEVHHKSTQVAAMEAGHRSRLEDLECLCANCHRLEHRRLRAMG